ncbi:fructose-6-phosphate aldolase [Roseobacter sp. SK209-2-6]|nr:fructose-6-phosphate aldolase [Roseobacter sp. SK209-2-6]
MGFAAAGKKCPSSESFPSTGAPAQNGWIKDPLF